jgi:hypothetical protein
VIVKGQGSHDSRRTGRCICSISATVASNRAWASPLSEVANASNSSAVSGGTGLTPPVRPDKVACPASRWSSSQPDLMRSPAQV